LLNTLAKICFFLCITFSTGILHTTASANDEIRWLNRWDASCYEQQYNVNTCRQDWYKTTQGSHLLMWEVFKTIELPNSEELFSSRNSLSRFGFLFPEQETYPVNSERYQGTFGERVEQNLSVDGMPLGFLEDKSILDNRNYLGLTCAACHTGEVSNGPNKYYVEGGQANADV